MRSFAGRVPIWIAALLVTTRLLAFQAGWSQLELPGPPATTVALYYPTEAAERAIPMGPFTLHVAFNARPEAAVKGLIMFSHGTGGSELGHSRLAEALARHGYLVAALRHPGDNWQDTSLRDQTPRLYFYLRPGQVSRVIDALLQDPRWKDRIAKDARGYRIGAVGHSAGGYTVLALAGGEPDLARIARHCKEEGSEDPIFCSMGRSSRSARPEPPPATPLKDARVRAVAALSPVGVVFTAASLAGIRIPTALYVAEQDRFLVPRFHGQWIARNMPRAELHMVPKAGHFAFMDTPTEKIPSPDGDIGADLPGFDRAAFLTSLGEDLSAFFDKAWDQPAGTGAGSATAGSGAVGAVGSVPAR